MRRVLPVAGGCILALMLAAAPASAADQARLAATRHKVIFQVSDGNNTRERWSSKPFPKGDGFFHHLAFVFDGRPSDPDDRRVDLYLDGVLVSGSSGSGVTPARTTSSNSATCPRPLT